MKTIIDFANKVKSLVDGRMSNIANVETSPSTHPYAVGKQLIFNGLLCKVTSAIAVGDTLAVGTNLALSDNVVEQIYSLNQGLTNSLADMNNVYGSKNLLPQTGEASSYHGVDFIVNSDGTVGFSGTITDDSTTYNYAVNEPVPNVWKGNTVTFGVFKDTIADVYAGLYVYDSSNTLVAEIGTNGNTHKESSGAIPSNADHYIVQIVFSNNRAVSGTLYPMIRLASIEDSTYVPYSMTNQQMTPYVQAISNPNLLDNPWFTVNQRRQSSYGVNTYSLDRWRSGNNNQVAISGNVVTLSPVNTSQSCVFYQVFEDEADGLNGKTVTLSLLDGSGNLYTVSHVVEHKTTWTQLFWKGFNDSFSIGLTAQPLTDGKYRYSFDINTYATKTLTIKAVKLELGSVSTLAQDTAPNYQQELAKCQRYFQRINIGTGQGLGYGVATSTTTARIVIPLTVPIRDVPPTISISNADQILINGSSHTITKMEYHAYRAQNNFITVTVTTTGLTNEQVCVLRAGNTVEVLEISTEL